jgi:glycosyltransferase involved in cell wall biosynthesis
MFADDMGSKVRAAALSWQVDAIYAHGLCAWGVRNAREWGVPMVANPHGMEEFKIKDPLKRLAYAPFRAWLRTGYRFADRVVATDYAMKDEVSSLLGVDPERVVVLPNGVDVEDIRGAVDPAVRAVLLDRWPGLRNGEAKLLGISVGRMEANKGFEHLLRALASAQPDLGRDWRWFFVGEGTLSTHLERVAGELGLSGQVIFTGKLSEQELHALYSLCNFFAHPTLYEGSSLVTLEAMAHALPVIASATGGIPDKVVDGETGFLVAPGDEAGLAARITWMAGHPPERVEMGRKGMRLAEAKFSWTHVAARTEELFLALLDEKAACRGQEVSA